MSPITHAFLPSEHHCNGHAVVLDIEYVFSQDHFILDNSPITWNKTSVPPFIIFLITMSLLDPQLLFMGYKVGIIHYLEKH